MNWQTIQRQLVREATANPKKAAFLGVLCVVCLYFWAPLVWGWVAGPKSKGGKKMTGPRSIAVSAAAQIAQAADSSPAANSDAPAEFDWKKADRLLSQDPYSTPVAPVAIGSNPFVAAIVIDRKPRVDETPDQILTPSQLGLTLSSTFLGRNRRVALINGRAYREGQILKLDGHRLRIAEVARDHVILVENGMSMRLSMNQDDEAPDNFALDKASIAPSGASPAALSPPSVPFPPSANSPP